MRLFIYKDGRQLGPFSLEEARARVLTGELSAGDWAWAEGATQWAALKSVPGFSTVPTTTAPAAESGFISPTAEEELWRGRPSQILNLKLYLFWAVVLLGVLFGLTIRRDAWPAFAALALIGLLQIVLRNLRLYACQYLVTTQRVRVTRGLLSRHIQEIELFRVKDLTRAAVVLPAALRPRHHHRAQRRRPESAPPAPGHSRRRRAARAPPPRSHRAPPALQRP